MKALRTVRFKIALIYLVYSLTLTGSLSCVAHAEPGRAAASGGVNKEAFTPILGPQFLGMSSSDVIAFKDWFGFSLAGFSHRAVNTPLAYGFLAADFFNYVNTDYFSGKIQNVLTSLFVSDPSYLINTAFHSSYNTFEERADVSIWAQLGASSYGFESNEKVYQRVQERLAAYGKWSHGQVFAELKSASVHNGFVPIYKSASTGGLSLAAGVSFFQNPLASLSLVNETTYLKSLYKSEVVPSQNLAGELSGQRFLQNSTTLSYHGTTETSELWNYTSGLNYTWSGVKNSLAQGRNNLDSDLPRPTGEASDNLDNNTKQSWGYFVSNRSKFTAFHSLVVADYGLYWRGDFYKGHQNVEPPRYNLPKGREYNYETHAAASVNLLGGDLVYLKPNVSINAINYKATGYHHYANIFVNPGLDVVVKFGRMVELNSGYQYGHKVAHIYQKYISGPGYYYGEPTNFRANSNLKTQKAGVYSFGAKVHVEGVNPEASLDFTANTYYESAQQYIDYSLSAQQIRYRNIPKAVVKGYSIGLNYALGPLTGAASYTYQDGWDTETHHRLTSIRPKQLLAKASFHAKTVRWLVPSAQIRAFGATNYQNSSGVLVKTPGYALVDLWVNLKFNGIPAGVTLGVNNILGKNYQLPRSGIAAGGRAYLVSAYYKV